MPEIPYLDEVLKEVKNDYDPKKSYKTDYVRKI